jgi:hypothetical protein
VVLLTLSALLMAETTQNGVEIWPDLGQGEVRYFATVGGTGNCTSWNAGCAFRTAVSKCTGTKQCNIYLGAGIHDTDNGSDANGTTVSVDYVRIVGFGDSGDQGQSSILANKAASVDYVVRVTGGKFSINRVVFDNSAQTDKNVTLLNLRGSTASVKNCVFQQGAADGGGTGILLDNSSTFTNIEANRLRNVIDYGINIGASSKVFISENLFLLNGTAVYASSASADVGVLKGNTYLKCTTGVNLAAAVAKTWLLLQGVYANCTTNFATVVGYGGTIYVEQITESAIGANTYPTGAGVSCNTGDGAWVWTAAATSVIPKDTISKPFRITNINFQDWSAAQTFKVELLYGYNTADTSLGIVEVTLGDPAARSKVDSAFTINSYVPANALVGAKVMSSTAGVDSATITIGYEPL